MLKKPPANVEMLTWKPVDQWNKVRDRCFVQFSSGENLKPTIVQILYVYDIFSHSGELMLLFSCLRGLFKVSDPTGILLLLVYDYVSSFICIHKHSSQLDVHSIGETFWFCQNQPVVKANISFKGIA